MSTYDGKEGDDDRHAAEILPLPNADEAMLPACCAIALVEMSESRNTETRLPRWMHRMRRRRRAREHAIQRHIPVWLQVVLDGAFMFVAVYVTRYLLNGGTVSSDELLRTAVFLVPFLLVRAIFVYRSR